MKRNTLALFAVNVALAAAIVGLFLWTHPPDAPTRDAQVAAGQVIFEETAGDIGCAACHGMDAHGDGAAPDIHKADVAEIMDALGHTGDMRGFGLSSEDVEAVAAYLAHLRSQAGI